MPSIMAKWGPCCWDRNVAFRTTTGRNDQTEFRSNIGFDRQLYVLVMTRPGDIRYPDVTGQFKRSDQYVAILLHAVVRFHTSDCDRSARFS
jgi:hypothetical protein